ncbi:MAG: hypothetical protein AB8H80_17075 [Planctomycetota bacterium]
MADDVGANGGDPSNGGPGGPEAMHAGPPNLEDGDQALRAIGDVSLRLLAGAVPKPRMEQLRRTVEQSPAEYPWQVVTQAVLAEGVDSQRLVQQGLTAQRDWILRGGRTAKGPSVGRRAKGFLARLVAQLIFGVLFTAVLLAGLIILQHKFEWLNIYEFWPWLRGLFAG